MANTAYFIDEQYLKDNSPLGKNIDMVTLYPFMKIAEDVHIQGVIGTNLYNDLITKISNSGYKLVKDKHTYDNRVDVLLNIINKYV
jgi:hypothetical protein